MPETETLAPETETLAPKVETKAAEEEDSKPSSGPPPVSSPPETLAPLPSVFQPVVAVPVMAVPCFLAPAALLDSPGFTGQFTMTHQAVLATVTAQAQMQLQAAYPSSPDVLTNSLSRSMSSSTTPAPLQSKPSPVPEENVSTPEAEQPPPSEQKSPSTQIVVKTGSTDGFNWRKYGQKQVKSSDRSRSYYRCTNSSCLAKKKVERCPDGRETEIIYRGNHNHDPPQKPRGSKERVQSAGPSDENECLNPPISEVNESVLSTPKTDQNPGNGPPEQQLYCSSDCEGDAAVKAEEDPSDEPSPKRRLRESIVPFSAPVLRTIKEHKIVVQSASEVGSITDGYRWRKYGQKIVKGNPNPRSYYRCTHEGCPVRKHVERASDDAKSIIITYEGKHSHGKPPLKSGSDRPASALVAAVEATNAEPLQALDPSDKTPTDRESNSNKASELGGEKALDSAEALLSIGLNSTAGEEASDGPNCSAFDKKCAAVPVQNS